MGFRADFEYPLWVRSLTSISPAWLFGSNLSLTTPAKKKDAITEPTYLGGLLGGRRTVMKDIGGAVHEVPLAWFQENALPPLPDQLKADNLQALVQDLKSRQIITSSGQWKGFTEPPVKNHLTEDKVSESFETVAGEVAHSAKSLTKRQPTILFKCNPNMCPESCLRKNSSKPDGYGLYTEHEGFEVYRKDQHVYWQFVVAPGEKKKAATLKDITDNNQKLLWSMNHIMREDPRRRFVVGYTIENVHMRLWFCSRADFFVSEKFNFTEDHRALAHFFVSLMYASSDQLGYDPTMRPSGDPKLRAQNQYDIDVQVERPAGSGRYETDTYRTERMLSNVGAEAIRGRGTRVWEAKKLVNVFNEDGTFADRVTEGEPKALKDSWIDDSREREAVIMAEILKSATPDQRKILLACMLTVLVYGDVRIDGIKDTTARMRNGQEVPTGRVFQLNPATAAPKTPTSTVNNDLAPIGAGLEVDVPVPIDLQVVVYDEKCHHRLVFEEVGTPIETVTTVSSVFEMLAQALFGLQTIHECGWVHRDISSGNILVVNTRAKICDVEYAKRTSDNSRHSLRTGTAYYMALEADSQAYYFTSRDVGQGRRRQRATDAEDAADFFGVKETPAKTATQSVHLHDPMKHQTPHEVPTVAQHPFKPNPIHDVESVWWLATRLVLNRKIVFRFTTDEGVWAIRTEQIPFYSRYFYNLPLRSQAILAEGHFVSGRALVSPVMRPVVDALEEARTCLVETYKTVEKDVSRINHLSAEDVSREIRAIFRELRDTYKQSDVELAPVSTPPAGKITLEQALAPIAALSLDPRRLDLKRKQGIDIGSAASVATPFSATEDRGQDDGQRAKRLKQLHPGVEGGADGSSDKTVAAEESEANFIPGSTEEEA